jgi:hypothetical protein
MKKDSNNYFNNLTSSNKNEIANAIISTALGMCDTEHIEMVVEKLLGACSNEFQKKYTQTHGCISSNAFHCSHSQRMYLCRNKKHSLCS